MVSVAMATEHSIPRFHAGASRPPRRLALAIAFMVAFAVAAGLLAELAERRDGPHSASAETTHPPVHEAKTASKVQQASKEEVRASVRRALEANERARVAIEAARRAGVESSFTDAMESKLGGDAGDAHLGEEHPPARAVEIVPVLPADDRPL